MTPLDSAAEHLTSHHVTSHLVDSTSFPTSDNDDADANLVRYAVLNTIWSQHARRQRQLSATDNSVISLSYGRSASVLPLIYILSRLLFFSEVITSYFGLRGVLVMLESSLCFHVNVESIVAYKQRSRK